MILVFTFCNLYIRYLLFQPVRSQDKKVYRCDYRCKDVLTDVLKRCCEKIFCKDVLSISTSIE